VEVTILFSNPKGETNVEIQVWITTYEVIHIQSVYADVDKRIRMASGGELL
jgi:hypothetical protein